MLNTALERLNEREQEQKKNTGVAWALKSLITGFHETKINNTLELP